MSAVVCTYIYIHAKYRWHRLTASARSLSKGVLVPDDRQLRGLLGKRTRREKETEKGKKNKGSAKRGRNYARSSRGDFLGSWNAEHRYVEQARRLEPSVKDRGGEERCLFSTVVSFFFFLLYNVRRTSSSRVYAERNIYLYVRISYRSTSRRSRLVTPTNQLAALSRKRYGFSPW